MYYLVTLRYVGPNPNEEIYIDFDQIQISTSPATKNGNKEICLEGWCGTTDDIAIYAHGQYATLDEARSVIIKNFGEVRCFENSDQQDVIEAYKFGRYRRMSSQETADWSYDSIQFDIKHDTTDARIQELVLAYEAEANSQGSTLHGDLEEFMIEHRTELLEDLVEDA